MNGNHAMAEAAPPAALWNAEFRVGPVPASRRTLHTASNTPAPAVEMEEAVNGVPGSENPSHRGGIPTERSATLCHGSKVPQGGSIGSYAEIQMSEAWRDPLYPEAGHGHRSSHKGSAR